MEQKDRILLYLMIFSLLCIIFLSYVSFYDENNIDNEYINHTVAGKEREFRLSALKQAIVAPLIDSVFIKIKEQKFKDNVDYHELDIENRIKKLSSLCKDNISDSEKIMCKQMVEMYRLYIYYKKFLAYSAYNIENLNKQLNQCENRINQ